MSNQLINNIIQVVVGVLYNNQNQILIAKRPLHKPFGGLWEFPGGKIELNESPIAALHRELSEELQIDIAINKISLKPFYQLTYAYQPTQHVSLHVYKITDFCGEPIGAEGQQIQWVQATELIHYEFPIANKKIIEQLISITST